MLCFCDILPETPVSENCGCRTKRSIFGQCWRPEAEPDIKSGLQGCLFVPLQILTANDLVCAQQRCLYLFIF